MPPETIFDTASKLINGDRRSAYGPAIQAFEEAAQIWSVILHHPVTARQVALCMAGYKLQRESFKPGRDNRVDMCGYIALADHIQEAAGDETKRHEHIKVRAGQASKVRSSRVGHKANR